MHILGCLCMASGIVAEHCMSAVVNFWHKRLSSVQCGVEVKLCAFVFFGATVDGGMWALTTVPQGQRLLCLLDGRLGWLQRQSGHFGEESIEITVNIWNRYRFHEHLLYEFLFQLYHHKSPFYVKMQSHRFLLHFEMWRTKSCGMWTK